MDPTENLNEQLEIVKRIQERDNEAGVVSWTSETLLAQSHDAERLAELVLVLDEWLSKGGFLPAHWQGVK